MALIKKILVYRDAKLYFWFNQTNYFNQIFENIINNINFVSKILLCQVRVMKN